MSQEVRDELQRGALVNALGVAGKIAGPSFLIVVTRLYGPDAFGVYITASAVVEMGIAFLTAGFKDAAVMFVSRHAEDERRSLYDSLANALGWSLFFATVLIALALTVGPAVLPQLYDYSDRLLLMVRWMALALPLMAFSRIVLAATQGLKIMKYEALVNGGLRPVLLLTLSSAFYLLASDVRGLTAGYVSTQVVAAVITAYVYQRELEWKPLFASMRSFRTNYEMMRFAIPQNINLTIERFLTNIDVLMLGYFGLNAQLVGFYGAGARIVRELRNVKLIFSSAFAPQIARFHHRGEIKTLGYTLATTLRWITTIAVPVLLAVAVLRSDLLVIVSPEYVGREALFMLFLLPIPYLQCSLGLTGNTVVMTGNSHLNLANNVVTGTINFLLNLWLIPAFGLIGAATASALATGVKSILEVSEMRYVVGVPFLVRELYEPHLAGWATAGVLLGVSVFYATPLAGSLGYRLGLLGGTLLLYGALLTLLQGRLPRMPSVLREEES
jgi:O-antigen/teichoic acid export membrane protein